MRVWARGRGCLGVQCAPNTQEIGPQPNQGVRAIGRDRGRGVKVGTARTECARALSITSSQGAVAVG